MDASSSYKPSTAATVLQCFACHKLFTQQSALNNYTRSCSKGKKQITNALSKPKGAYFEQEEKKRKQQEETLQSVQADDLSVEAQGAGSGSSHVVVTVFQETTVVSSTSNFVYPLG